jgi:hypothetical protein
MRTVNLFDVQEWDALVVKTYGRPYSFQQQEGCKDRGTYYLTVPDKDVEDGLPESVPEEVNGDEMCVKFTSWLARDPKKQIPNEKSKSSLVMWWERNFYPDVQAVANDLHAKGLLEAGEYVIDIDW